MPTWVEPLISRIIVVLIVALGVDAVVSQREQPTPRSIVVTVDQPAWSSSDMLHSKDAVGEAGWLRVADALRSLTRTQRVYNVDAPITRQALRTSIHASSDILGARAAVDGAKSGRDTSNSTAVPPPTI